MESLLENVELRYDLRRKVTMDSNSTMETNVQNISKYDDDEKLADGYCSQSDNSGRRYNKLATDVDCMVKDIQRLKENQEYKFLEDKSNMLPHISVKDNIVQFNDRKNTVGNKLVLATALDRLAKLDVSEKTKEIKDDDNYVSPLLKENEVDLSRGVDGHHRSVWNGEKKDLILSEGGCKNVNSFSSTTSEFCIILLAVMIFVVCIVANLTPRICNGSIGDQMAPHLPFLQLSWSDGLPPM